MAYGRNQLSLCHARALGAADAAIIMALLYCKHPGSNLSGFVEEIRDLLTRAQVDIEAIVNGKDEAERGEAYWRGAI